MDTQRLMPSDLDSGTHQSETEMHSDSDDHRRQKALEAWADFHRSIGCRLWSATLDSFVCEHDSQRQAVANLRRYVENIVANVAAGNGLVFIGPPGTGKDHLAAAVAKAAIKESWLAVRYKAGLDLFAEFRDAIQGNRSEDKIVDPLVSADVLLLSDPLPPRGNVTDYQAAMLELIIDRRYRNCKPTWVTLNVGSGKEADERLGTPIVDRLRHGATVIACNWPTYRKAATNGE